ncbi:Guanylate kinase [Pandoravirus kuranda]|nr:Guanylate kinase [Pandoravirus kuranda]
MQHQPEGKKRKREAAADDRPLPAESDNEDGDAGVSRPVRRGPSEKGAVRESDHGEGAPRGRLLVLVGPSGSGKTTLAKALGFTPLCTTTCRAPRPGEVDGVDYHFVSDDAFERLVANGLMAEHASYAGVRYGVPVALIDAVRQGTIAVGDAGQATADNAQSPTFVIILNADGVDTMRRLLGRRSVLAVHVSAPLDRLEARLCARGSTHAEIDKRIRQAEAIETTPAYMARCDACVVNADGHLDKTIETVRDLCAAYFGSPLVTACAETAAVAHDEGNP